MTESASPLRAAVYGRESQANATSIDDQVELGVELVDELGWLLVRTYDDGGSASRFARKERKDWEQLVKDLDAGLIDVVILNEVSRGDRKAGVGLTVLDVCRERGVLIHVISDDTTYDPRKVRQWKALADAFIDADAESSRTSEQTIRGVRHAAKTGCPPMGVTPYGYARHRHTERTADNKLKVIVDQFPDPETAPIAQEIFAKVAKSVPLKTIVRELNTGGVAAPGRAGEWSAHRLRWMVRNPAYIGKRVYRKQGRNGNRQHPQLFDGNWEPLVSEETWYAAQRVLDDPKRVKVRPGRQRHLLSYLGECDREHPLTVRRHNRYACTQGCVYVAERDLDDFVEAATLEALADPEIYGRLVQAGQTSDVELQAARDEASALRARLDDYRQRARRGELDADDFVEISGGLKIDIQHAEQRAARIGLPPALRAFIEPGVDAEARWKDSTVQAKRAVIRTLFTITVRPMYRKKGVPLEDRVEIAPRMIGRE